jgi:hypothetical protein
MMAQIDMGPVHLSARDWRTLESFAGKIPKTVAVFRLPAGVKIKVRYGFGWLGWDRQSTTTDGRSDKRVVIEGVVGWARMQAKSERDAQLTWIRMTEGPGA